MVVLCPLYEIDQERGCESFCWRLTKRIVPFCINNPFAGLFKTSVTRIVKRETFAYGACNSGSSSLVVEYVHPADFNDRELITSSNESIEEVEFGNEPADHASTPAGVVFCTETSKEGQRIIRKAKAVSMKVVSQIRGRPRAVFYARDFINLTLKMSKMPVSTLGDIL